MTPVRKPSNGNERFACRPSPQQGGKRDTGPNGDFQGARQAGVDLHQQGAAGRVTAKLDFAVALQVQGAHQRQSGGLQICGHGYALAHHGDAAESRRRTVSDLRELRPDPSLRVEDTHCLALAGHPLLGDC